MIHISITVHSDTYGTKFWASIILHKKNECQVFELDVASAAEDALDDALKFLALKSAEVANDV